MPYTCAHWRIVMSTSLKALGGMFVLALSLIAADSPFVGTWKQSPTKSKMEGSGLGSTGLVRIEQDGAGLKISVEATLQGQPNNFTYQATLDNKPTKVIGTPGFDEIWTMRADDHTLTASGRKAGAVVFTDRRVVSGNGKTMTIFRSGTNAEGKPFKATMVFDRQ
jgi:hypothetical protein